MKEEIKWCPLYEYRIYGGNEVCENRRTKPHIWPRCQRCHLWDIRLKALREKLGWSRKEMANFLGIHKDRYSHYERGDEYIPRKHWGKVERLILGDSAVSPEVPEIIEESTMENREEFNPQVLDIIEKS